jgi:hypothetical protein
MSKLARVAIALSIGTPLKSGHRSPGTSAMRRRTHRRLPAPFHPERDPVRRTMRCPKCFGFWNGRR